MTFLLPVRLDLELLKTNCEEEFHQWFIEITALANELNISVSTPRITSRQVHRSNAPADSPESYYRRNIMVPFLDHITSELIWTDPPNQSQTSRPRTICCSHFPRCLNCRQGRVQRGAQGARAPPSGLAQQPI